VITTDKITQVGEALEQVTRAQEAVELLRGDEPNRGTPTLRARELHKIALDLAEIRRQISELWS
jgi:hypothetical protein